MFMVHWLTSKSMGRSCRYSNCLCIYDKRYCTRKMYKVLFIKQNKKCLWSNRSKNVLCMMLIQFYLCMPFMQPDVYAVRAVWMRRLGWCKGCWLDLLTSVGPCFQILRRSCTFTNNIDLVPTPQLISCHVSMGMQGGFCWVTTSWQVMHQYFIYLTRTCCRKKSNSLGISVCMETF